MLKTKFTPFYQTTRVYNFVEIIVVIGLGFYSLKIQNSVTYNSIIIVSARVRLKIKYLSICLSVCLSDVGVRVAMPLNWLVISVTMSGNGTLLD